MSIAIEIAETDDAGTQLALQQAYEKNLLRGRKLLIAKRVVDPKLSPRQLNDLSTTVGLYQCAARVRRRGNRRLSYDDLHNMTTAFLSTEEVLEIKYDRERDWAVSFGNGNCIEEYTYSGDDNREFTILEKKCPGKAIQTQKYDFFKERWESRPYRGGRKRRKG